jgi:hypothetical protein
MLTSKQRALARHALGLPNKSHQSSRNHYCTSVAGNDRTEWEAMVAQGDAVKGSGDFFHLTLKGALEAREPEEHVSREDAERMRVVELEDSPMNWRKS